MRSPIEKKNILLTGNSPLTAKQMKLFKYFGAGAKIKPPYRILNPHRISIGDRTSIQEGCHINAFQDLSFLMQYIDKKYKKDFKTSDYLYDPHIEIGRACQIGRFFFASCTQKIKLHDHVLLSERVFLGDNNHTYTHKQVPILQQPNSRGQAIEIKSGSWVGVGASLLQGTKLGENCVVGANSVVAGVFPSYAVIGQERAKILFLKK
jgi:acetyltransferase-like isoleucine patch superfamily enzyme